MTAYLLKRLLLIIPTLFGIMLISFVIVQFAPGGPVERIAAHGHDSPWSAHRRRRQDALPGGSQRSSVRAAEAVTSKYRGAQGLDKEFIKSLEKQFGFDKPAHERFILMMKNYLLFDFGKSYFRDVSVMQLIKEKLPVSISLGIWMTLITYLISIPLGIRKAMHDGEVRHLDLGVLVSAMPSRLPVAVFLLVMFLNARSSSGTPRAVSPPRTGASCRCWARSSTTSGT
jgi:microcin C transport system permease protein